MVYDERRLETFVEGPMKLNQLFAFDGVFAAVKCVRCGAVYDATSQDFIGLHGQVSVGLNDALIGVDKPKRPRKHGLAVVCRTPECMESLVRAMLGCDEAHARNGTDPEGLWHQVLEIWGYKATEAPEPDVSPPRSKRR